MDRKPYNTIFLDIKIPPGKEVNKCRLSAGSSAINGEHSGNIFSSVGGGSDAQATTTSPRGELRRLGDSSRRPSHRGSSLFGMWPHRTPLALHFTSEVGECLSQTRSHISLHTPDVLLVRLLASLCPVGVSHHHDQLALAETCAQDARRSTKNLLDRHLIIATEVVLQVADGLVVEPLGSTTGCGSPRVTEFSGHCYPPLTT